MSKANKLINDTVSSTLEKHVNDNNWNIIYTDYGDRFHVSVRNEHGTLAHAFGKNKDNATSKVLSLLNLSSEPIKNKPAKAIAKKRTKS